MWQFFYLGKLKTPIELKKFTNKLKKTANDIKISTIFRHHWMFYLIM